MDEQLRRWAGPVAPLDATDLADVHAVGRLVQVYALGVDSREVESNKELNWCCGGGAGVFLINSASDLRQKAFQIKMRQVANTGADSVVTACGSCRLNFLNGKMRAGWDTGIESLVELVAEALPSN